MILTYIEIFKKTLSIILNHASIFNLGSIRLPDFSMNNKQKYRVVCTLSFGDIYAQIMIWLIVIFISLASAVALWSSSRQIYALATVGLVLVLSLPFLLFAFVTTLLNHIEVTPIEVASSPSRSSATQQPAQATS